MATKKAATPVLYKPFGSPGSANAGKAVASTAADAKSVDLVDANGNVIAHGVKDTARHTPEPGAIPGPYNQNWGLGSAYGIPKGASIRVTNADGSFSYAALPSPFQSYKGFVNDGEGTSPSNAAILPANSHSEGGQGIQPGFGPGQVGQFGNAPAYIGGLFPNAVLAQYNPITAAPYNFTDPQKFAQQFGQFNRGEIQKNFDLSKDLALKELNTELSSLQNFVPAAAALKRSEVSLDNQFNQAQRTQQINQVLPNAVGDLNAQASRARTYAAGGVPDPVANQAFEAGIRSAAADRAAAGGFGATSSVARKASDLLSADQRIQLSRYGDSLLSSNLNQSAGLLLAPTSYSNAGQQVSVMPSESSSQLINSNLNAINGLTTINPSTALSSTTQQNQFTTGLEQQTRQFNAGNSLNASEFNAGAQNNFALDKFGYQANYAGAVAGAAQTDTNTNFQLQQQQMFNDLMMQYMQQSQNAGLTNSLVGGIFGLLGGGLKSGGLSSLTNKGGGASGPFAGSVANGIPGASNSGIDALTGAVTGGK